jgi:hypothetical protein
MACFQFFSDHRCPPASLPAPPLGLCSASAGTAGDGNPSGSDASLDGGALAAGGAVASMLAMWSGAVLVV